MLWRSRYDGLARYPMKPQDIIDAAVYLEQKNFPVELLRDLHHSRHRSETLARTMRYFATVSELHANNVRYGERLTYIAREHQRTGHGFEQLTKEALERY